MSRESIDPIRERIDAAWLRSDADGITGYLAEDAILLPPHAPRQVGRRQINSWLKELFEHYTMTELAMPSASSASLATWPSSRAYMSGPSHRGTEASPFAIRPIG
jgi:hypothetical protein